MSVPNTLYIEGRVLLPFHEAMNIFIDGTPMVDMGQTLIIIASFTWHCLFWVFHNDSYYPAIHALHHEGSKPLDCYIMPYTSP